MGHNPAQALRDQQANDERFRVSLAALAAGRRGRLVRDQVGVNHLARPNLVNQTAEPPKPRPAYVKHDVAAAQRAEAFGRLSLKQRKKILARLRSRGKA